MKKIIYITLIALTFLYSNNTSAQCKKFANEVGKPLLRPYISNGQLNTTSLSEGDAAELIVTFYSRQKYRIVVCSEENLKNVTFTLSDLNGNVFFTNADYDFINHWDFKTSTTQKLRIEVKVPKDKNNKSEETETGCVSILVGFRGM